MASHGGGGTSRHLRFLNRIEDLPAELTIDILSRHPVKAIFHCKCFCKKWRNLLVESSFVHLHLSGSPTTLIIHHKPNFNVPGILEWVEIEDKDDYHHLRHDPLMSLDLNLAPILQISPIELVGSVNGLICLMQSSLGPNDTYICNPVTREYMILPRQQDCYTEDNGFGMSSTTVEYKVIRTFRCHKSDILEAKVYTLGTGQWTSLGRVPYEFHGYYAPFLNNCCHWIVCDEEDASERLFTFDFDKETFQLFPSPPVDVEAIQGSDYHYDCLAILKGYLCKTDTYDSQFTIWVMKEYGIKESWHKEVVINQAISPRLHWPMWDPLNLIEGLKDGSILTQCEDKLWAFYPKNKTIQDTGLFEFSSSPPRGMAYRPGFLKLRNFELERVHMF